MYYVYIIYVDRIKIFMETVIFYVDTYFFGVHIFYFYVDKLECICVHWLFAALFHVIHLISSNCTITITIFVYQYHLKCNINMTTSVVFYQRFVINQYSHTSNHTLQFTPTQFE